ncbi:MAG: FAD-dependent oxidoreductase [Blastochloris sp.]|nr:FAD-dependent oxidoreductase [Blastochloris sp.]
MDVKVVSCDVVILGGGVAGLWLLQRLRREGYSVALFENQCLGGEQTVASQGVIHGGLKYALNGVLNDASEQLLICRDVGARAWMGKVKWICARCRYCPIIRFCGRAVVWLLR